VALREQGAEDRRAAETDELTGLGNRRKLVSDLERQAAEATAEDPLLLGLFDLDGFKAYNDTFGHQSGDALLKRLGVRLAAAVAPSATAYRMGGDEFCILARTAGVNRDMLLAAAGEALAETGEGFGVGASHGSVLLPEEAADPSTALRLADARMYARKSVSRGSAGRQTADALMRVLAERHPDLDGHVSEVSALADALGRALEMQEDDLVALQQAAALHDVGKLAVPEAILSKPGPLDEHEWDFVRRHTLVGERILGAAPALAPAARIVRSSHERFDGRGYPDGLAGEAIPLGSRVIAVCDSYNAMTSTRPYRRTPMSCEGALEELRRQVGEQFDPRVVHAFEQLLSEARPLLSR
jgi:diguanylate cyclase (GGDEF)-like protein